MSDWLVVQWLNRGAKQQRPSLTLNRSEKVKGKGEGRHSPVQQWGSVQMSLLTSFENKEEQAKVRLTAVHCKNRSWAKTVKQGNEKRVDKSGTFILNCVFLMCGWITRAHRVVSVGGWLKFLASAYWATWTTVAGAVVAKHNPHSVIASRGNSLLFFLSLDMFNRKWRPHPANRQHTFSAVLSKNYSLTHLKIVVIITPEYPPQNTAIAKEASHKHIV